MQIVAFENPFQFCALFQHTQNMELLRKLELLQDLGDLFKKGIGDASDANAFGSEFF